MFLSLDNSIFKFFNLESREDKNYVRHFLSTDEKFKSRHQSVNCWVNTE
jgi:hypothetical protein